MLASTHLDPVVGIDIHWEMVPMPAPVPTPLPNPFVGMVWDPMGLAVGLVISQVVDRLTGSPPTGGGDRQHAPGDQHRDGSDRVWRTS